MSQDLLQSLVWMDYRLAVLFAVVLPLIILIWATVKQSDAIVQLLIIYWRVASLLAITVFLMIANLPMSFIPALAAHILIPIALWFWVDLNEEIDDQSRRPLKLAFTSWRWATSIYFGLGAIAQLFVLRCAFSKSLFQTPFCQVWLDPPKLFKAYFLGYTPGFWGFLGILGLIIYVLYLANFVVFRLNKQGRSAIQN
ncbi:MAG: DUF3177 family protein [Synechococcales cyanobacterium T60_A2020_003]|nr:DUF3177 family protein [Synechococcales cyanobacterium T60_A2020_003]